MDIIFSATVFIFGSFLVIAAILSAVRTFVLPRAAQDPIVRFVFLNTRRVFEWFALRRSTYEQRDRLLAFYAPITLLLLLPVWLTIISLGFMGMFWATGVRPLSLAFTVSGSSLLTLGFARGESLLQMVLAFTEATIGLIMVALLIAYLPTMYSAFSQRERAVTMLEVRAGSPPSAVEMLARLHRIDRLEELSDFWETWEAWFALVAESHTSLPALVFFRSPKSDSSWLTATGAILDGAALKRSVVDLPGEPQEALCIRAGFVTLRQIADFFGISYDPNPQYPEHPISITRAEFDQACEMLAEQGIPLYSDRDQAWQDFAGWRVNYDHVLLELCRLTMAPNAPWSADRAALPRQSPSQD